MSYYLNGKVVANFWQIDDKLTLYVNNKEVFSHGLIQHGEPSTSCVLSNYLNPGKNTVRVAVYNGPGWGVLIGALTSDSGFTHKWHYVNANAPKNSIIIDDTIEIFYEDKVNSSPREKVLLSFSEIDDYVTITLNGGEKVFHCGLLRHNQDKVIIDLTNDLHWGSTNNIQVTATNGPGSAALVGQLTVGKKTFASWNKHPGHAVGRGVFMNDNIKLDL